MQFEARNLADVDATQGAETQCEPAICRCFGVSKTVIQSAIVTHQLRSVDEVTACTQAGGACTGCHRKLRHMLADHYGDPTLAQPPRRRGAL